MRESVDYLRQILAQQGFTRKESLGEIYQAGNTTVLIGANEVVITTHNPTVHRRFQRAAGGMDLAVEYLRSQGI